MTRLKKTHVHRRDLCTCVLVELFESGPKISLRFSTELTTLNLIHEMKAHEVGIIYKIMVVP
jgi:hypothetical protein